MYDARLLDQIFQDDAVKPMPGYVICEKYVDTDKVFVEGFGWVNSKGVTPGGLVMVSNKTSEQDYVNAVRYVVRRVGDNPDAWRFRCLSTGGSWNGKDPGKPINRNFRTTWDAQKIEVGTVLAARAVSGTEQDRDSRFLALRYDEICAIGKPLDETEGFEMRPAPGWVMVQKEEVAQRNDNLVVYAGLQQLMNDGLGTIGRVIELPRETDSEGLQVGDRIMFPSHAPAGATEYIEFGGGIRCLPLEDVLLVMES